MAALIFGQQNMRLQMLFMLSKTPDGQQFDADLLIKRPVCLPDCFRANKPGVPHEGHFNAQVWWGKDILCRLHLTMKPWTPLCVICLLCSTIHTDHVIQNGIPEILAVKLISMINSILPPGLWKVVSVNI